MSSKTPIRIESNFSVYSACIEKSHSSIFSENKQLLARWCRSIEELILEEAYPAIIFVSFQNLKNLLPVINRYKKLANIAESIYVFGQAYPTMPVIDHLHYVELRPEDELSKEWFLVVDTPSYSRALIAMEISEENMPASQRIYKGVLSNDTELIYPIYQQLLAKVGHNKN